MKFINFDNYIKKMIMNILIKTVFYLNIHLILLLLDQVEPQKPTYCLIF